MATEVVPGLSTEDLVEAITNFGPPMRPDGVGITPIEYVKARGLSQRSGRHQSNVRKKLAEMGCVPVKMTVVNAGGQHRKKNVWMPKQEALERYPDWIMELEDVHISPKKRLERGE